MHQDDSSRVAARMYAAYDVGLAGDFAADQEKSSLSVMLI